MSRMSAVAAATLSTSGFGTGPVRSLALLLARILTFGVLAVCTPVAMSDEPDAAAGKGLYPICTACHGPSGQGNQAMNAPKIAGQESWYLIGQMQLFQSGARGAAPGDMTGMQMAAMAKGPQFSSEQALENLAAYIGTFPVEAAPATVEGDFQAGEKLYAVCAACHGQKAEGIEAMRGPRLAGQSDWYMVAQIKKFQEGKRGYHDSDHGGRQMRPMVTTLTDDKAIRDVVAYIGTLR